MKILLKICLVLISTVIVSCSCPLPLLSPDKSELNTRAPNKYNVEFTTTKGIFQIEVNRDYSPLAVDRFYYLVKKNYYNDNRFFRVVPNFVIQWGMKGNPKVDKIWEELGVVDEPVELSNTKGTISFARSGPNTRSTQLFINLKDNVRLDNSEWGGVKGFPAFGKVIKGIEVVEAINSEYRELPNQDSISVNGNNYLKKNFPNLDYIISAVIKSN